MCMKALQPPHRRRPVQRVQEEARCFHPNADGYPWTVIPVERRDRYMALMSKLRRRLCRVRAAGHHRGRLEAGDADELKRLDLARFGCFCVSLVYVTHKR